MNKIFTIGMGLIATLASVTLTAATPQVSAVDSQHCAMMKKAQTPFILALRKGEKVQEAISRCANDAELNGAALSGLGAFQPATLRYYDHINKVYQDKEIPDFMEVTNLTGNVSFIDNIRKNHIHVTLSDHNFIPQAGHLKDASVGAVLEILVNPLPHKVFKEHDYETGLDIIQSPK